MELSKESRALRESYAAFKRGVDPDTIITMLYSKLLLTPEEKGKAKQRMLTIDEQLDVIFECLERRVSADSSIFNKLVQLLLEEPVLKAVGKKLQGMSGWYCCMFLYLTNL